MASAANASAHGPLGSDDASQAAPRGSRNLIDWKAVDIAAAKDALFQRTINDGIYHIHSHAESAKKSGSLTDKNFEAGCRQAQQDLGSGDYHIYIDYTRFAYNIILTRPERSSANIHTIKLKVSPRPDQEEHLTHVSCAALRVECNASSALCSCGLMVRSRHSISLQDPNSHTERYFV